MISNKIIGITMINKPAIAVIDPSKRVVDISFNSDFAYTFFWIQENVRQSDIIFELPREYYEMYKDETIYAEPDLVKKYQPSFLMVDLLIEQSKRKILSNGLWAESSPQKVEPCNIYHITGCEKELNRNEADAIMLAWNKMLDKE